MSHDSFAANPLSVDVLAEVSAQKGSIFCPSENDETKKEEAFASMTGVSVKEEHLAELQQKAFKSAAASLVIILITMKFTHVIHWLSLLFLLFR